MSARGSEVLFLLWLGGQAGKGEMWFCSCPPEALSRLLCV